MGTLLGTPAPKRRSARERNHRKLLRDCQEDALSAAEVTGHYYFRDFHYADNGFIPSLLILELMPARLFAIESRYNDAQLQKMDGVSVDYPD